MTEESVSLSSHINELAFSIVPPCKILISAALFNEPPTPSGAPLPCPASWKFQDATEKSLAASSVEK